MVAVHSRGSFSFDHAFSTAFPELFSAAAPSHIGPEGLIILIDYINFCILRCFINEGMHNRIDTSLFPKKLNLFTNKLVKRCRALSNYEALHCSASLKR